MLQIHEFTFHRNGELDTGTLHFIVKASLADLEIGYSGEFPRLKVTLHGRCKAKRVFHLTKKVWTIQVEHQDDLPIGFRSNSLRRALNIWGAEVFPIVSEE